MKAMVPANEAQRLRTLHAYNVLDTLPEQAYDDITFLASRICGTPIALVSLVDEDRQWFKSRVGLDATQTPRDVAFCAHAINTPEELFIVSDAREDSRFADNPLVTDAPSIRFYAGAPLVTRTGMPLGTLCVIDRVPRTLSPEQTESLRALSRQVMAQLDLARSLAALTIAMAESRRYSDQLEDYQRKLEETNAQLEAMSFTDALTGLKNRRAFEEQLDQAYTRAVRYGRQLSLVLVDVDNFKVYNDTYGHQSGDVTLQLVARALERATRDSDTVARYGGEEFAVILPETGAEGGLVLAERLRREVERGPWEGPAVTASVGIATLDPSGKRASLIAAADQALYHSKITGKNRVTGTTTASVGASGEFAFPPDAAPPAERDQSATPPAGPVTPILPPSAPSAAATS